MRNHPIRINASCHPVWTSGPLVQVGLQKQGLFSTPPLCSPPKFRQVLQNNCKTKGVGGRKVRDVITHLLAFLSCLCLHSSVDGHQLEKKLQRNWTRPLPSTSLASEHNSWARDALHRSWWWVRADCRCTWRPLQRVQGPVSWKYTYKDLIKKCKFTGNPSPATWLSLQGWNKFHFWREKQTVLGPLLRRSATLVSQKVWPILTSITTL